MVNQMKNSKRQIVSELAKEIKYQSHNVAKIKNSLKLASKNGFDFNTKYSGGKTLLHYATIADVSGIIGFLIKLGVNPDICDDHYNTPLHMAVRMNRYQVVKELLKYPVDINALGEFDQTPLHLAVISGNLDIVQLLISKNADITLVDEKNYNPLDYAKDEKNEKIYNYLKSELEK